MAKLGRAIAWTAVAIVAIGLLLRACVFTVWTIPEDDPVLAAAIAPTLREGDTVLLLKIGTPTFGDLVRCADPEDGAKFVVGRVAGVERDVVETEGPRLIVNGQHYESESACPDPTFTIKHPTKHDEVELHCDVVRMGSGWHHRGAGRITERRARTEVLSGRFFILSDDRSYHDDSRDFGALQRSACTQRVVYRLWAKEGWSNDRDRMMLIH